MVTKQYIVLMDTVLVTMKTIAVKKNLCMGFCLKLH